MPPSSDADTPVPHWPSSPVNSTEDSGHIARAIKPSQEGVGFEGQITRSLDFRISDRSTKPPNSALHPVDTFDDFNLNTERRDTYHGAIQSSDHNAASSSGRGDRRGIVLLGQSGPTAFSQPAVTLQSLPLEVRQHIFSYVVTVPQSIHVYEARDSLGYIGDWGWRLSLCEEFVYDWRKCECRCQQGQNSRVNSQFFDNALLLVSRTTRREALDVFFSENKFTFCDLNDLELFSNKFSSSTAKIRSLRLFVRIGSTLLQTNIKNHGIDGLAIVRSKLDNLQDLKLYVYQHETLFEGDIHEDDIIGGLCSFAFPRVSKFGCRAYFPDSYGGKIWSALGHNPSDFMWLASELARRVESKLTDIFCGTYKTVDDIKIRPEPTRKSRRGLPPTSKRGMLALED